MNLPFSETAFLDVFGAYNRALWPVVIVLWAVTAGMAVRWWRQGYGDRSLSALLAVHWAWSGVAYHWFFFRSINPAALLLAGFFVVEAALFTWLWARAVRPQGVSVHSRRRGLAISLADLARTARQCESCGTDGAAD